MAERLAAGVLGLDGYTNIDPQAPLGGPDGAVDILCERNGTKCLGAVYFPVSQNSFPKIRKKFGDLTGSFCTKRFERNWLGKEPGYAEEAF